MDIQRLKIFCEVYRQHSFSAAGKRLGLTQSAVSQQIRALEQELGVTLFEGRRRSSPTAAGDFLFKEGSLILASIDDVRRGVQHVSGIGKGSVRFGMIDAVAIELMPGVLSAFRKSYPEIKVEAVVKASGELIGMVEEHDLDFALAVTNRLPDELIAQEISSDSIVAVLPAGKRGGQAKELSIQDLRGEPLIIYPLSSYTRMVIEDVFRAQGIVPTVNMEMHYPAAICSLVEQGMGVGLISELSARESRLKGQRIVPVLELKHARKIGIVWHRRRKPSPQALALIEMMMAMRRALMVRKEGGRQTP